MTQELSQWSLVMLMAASIAVGFAFGALYDLFRIRRRASELTHRPKKLLTRYVQGFIIVLEDVVFFVFLACTTAVMYHVFTNGRVRLAALVFEALGFALYRISIGRLVMSVSSAVIAFFVMVLNALMRCIIAPVVRLVRRTAEAIGSRFGGIARAQRRRRLSEYRKKRLLKESKRGLL